MEDGRSTKDTRGVIMTTAIIIVTSFFAFFLTLNGYYKWVVIRNEQEAHIKRSSHVKQKYDIVAFGSSYCRYAFDFSGTGLCGCNFGFVAQFFYYTDKMIRAFAPTFKPGAIVVITVPDLVFAEVGNGLYHPQRYVLFLPKEVLGREYSWINHLRYNYFPLTVDFKTNIKKMVKMLLHGRCTNTYETMLHNPLDRSGVMVEALKRTEGWVKSFKLESTFNGNVPEELEQKFVQTTFLLQGMIQHCIEMGYKPCLVIPPVSRPMNTLLSDNFLETVLFNNIRRANVQNIPVFNYLRDPRFQDIDLYAANADFLNARGRKLFTQTFLKDLGHISKKQSQPINFPF